ncbi:MAG: hypothetical protein ACOYZ6_15820 [Chloroflexota bacterium]
MNTKLLMTSTSLILGAAGLVALFLPDWVLSMQGLVVTAGASLLVQMLGAVYIALAAMDWTAKDSVIGGIYARPVSLANFSHFFIGALLLVKYDLSHAANSSLWAATAVYVFFAACFYWLVFRATGTKS